MVGVLIRVFKIGKVFFRGYNGIFFSESLFGFL